MVEEMMTDARIIEMKHTFTINKEEKFPKKYFWI